MPTKAEKLLAKGQALEKKGKRDKALEVYRDACRAEPYDPDLWTARADTAKALGMSGEAAESLFHVCDLYARSGMPSEALEVVGRVLTLDASHGGAKRLKRMLEQRLGSSATEAGDDRGAVPVATPDEKTLPSAVPPIPARPSTGRVPSVSAQVAAVAGEISAKPMPAPVPVSAPEPEPELEPELEPDSEPEAVPERASSSSDASSSMIIEIDADEPEEEEVVLLTKKAKPKRAESAPVAPMPSQNMPVAPGRARPMTVPPPTPGEGGLVPEFFGESLESISLVERLPSTAAQGGTTESGAEISLDEAQVDVVQAVASTLSASPLLSELDSDLVRHLIDCGKLVRRGADEVVFRQGQMGTSLFLILSGEVSVVRESRQQSPDPNRGGSPGFAGRGAEPPERELARLRAGAFFGEMALLTNTPRSATVMAVKSSDFLEISRKAVRELIDRDPRVLKLLMRFFRARLVGTLIQTSALFKPFSRDERRQVISRFRLRELGAEQAVIREGTSAEGLFVVLVGKLEVLHSLKPSSGKKGNSGGGDGASVLLGTLVPGDLFGEMSLLDGSAAMATVRTRTRSWVLLLPKDDYQELAAKHPQIRDHLAALADERRTKNKAALGHGGGSVSEGRLEPV